MKFEKLIAAGVLAVAAIPAQATICGPDQMHMRGHFNGWTNTAMSCDTNAAEWVARVTFGDNDAFKFDVMGDWIDNHGDNAPADGQADQGGDNIQVNAAGEYDVRFNYRSDAYSVTPVGGSSACGAPSMHIRGNFNGWAANAMACENGVFTTALNLSAATGFKFDQNGDWVNNWGDNNPADAQVDAGGNNIQVAAGNYTVSFDYNAGTYSVVSNDQTGEGTVILNLNNRVWNNNQYQLEVIGGSRDYWLDDAQPQMPQMPDGQTSNGQVTLTLSSGQHEIVVGCLCSSFPEGFFLSNKVAFNVVAGTTTTIDLTFQIGTVAVTANASTSAGQAIYITGESEELGSWGTAKRLFNVNGSWRYEGAGQPTTEFKLIRATDAGAEISTSGVEWQQGSNNVVPAAGTFNPYRSSITVTPQF